MNNDKNYEELKSKKIMELQNEIDYYNGFINPCALQDRVLENIVQIAKDLENIHKEQLAEKPSVGLTIAKVVDLEDQVKSKKR